MFDLTGRKMLVTGATGGIGAAIARTFHAAGGIVAISGRRTEKLEELKQDLGGDRVHIFAADLGQEEDVLGLVAKVHDALDGFDTLVNNAGITKDGLMMRMKDDAFDDVIRVDLRAPFILSRAALKYMMKARFGRIINITSIVGVTGNPGQANYCAAKAGLIGMTKSLAAEIATRGITVNCLAPGFIASPMTDVLKDAQKEALEASIPMRHIGEPKDIAAAALYLASSEASYMTGQTLHVNGGMAMI